MSTRALVLGGGGSAGIAWESGLLLGLARAGVDISAPDLVVGTSGGSVVAVMLRAGMLTDERLAQMMQTGQRGSGEALAFDAMAFYEMMQSAIQGGGDPQAARAQIGERARGLQVSLPQQDWVEQIGSMLPEDWPQGALAITAVDAESGEFTVFNSSSTVPLERAVAASCTVPSVYPLVEIDGRLYMDGGMRSSTNADVAVGHDKVLVVSCGPEQPVNPVGPTLTEAMQLLDAHGHALLLTADEPSLRIFGTNPLDPATVEPAFAAGQAQAEACAADVLSFWKD